MSVLFDTTKCHNNEVIQMKKKYKFKVEYRVHAELEVELNDAQQVELATADLTLIRTYLEEWGYAEFISNAAKTEEYEIIWYQKVEEEKAEELFNIELANLDICFFYYRVPNEEDLQHDYMFGNLTTEKSIKQYIIDRIPTSVLTVDDIIDLTIHR